jgi:hypothetical protein
MKNLRVYAGSNHPHEAQQPVARRGQAEQQEQGAPKMADLSSLKDLGTASEAAAPVHVRKVDAQGRSYATGKRKNAVARVWVKPGSGKITSTARNSRPISHVRFCR